MKIRAYQKGQLAQMFYPWCGKRAALRRFAQDLDRALTLKEELQLTGWSETTRVLTPQQVKLIVETIGDP